MICEYCDKEAKKKHFTKIIHDDDRTAYLCHDCVSDYIADYGEELTYYLNENNP